MSSKFIFVAAVAVAGSLACQGAAAQAASSPSRADVKAETRAAAKTGEMDAGVRGGPKPKSTGTSTMTRAERKKATAEANKAGELEGAGVRGPGGPAVTSNSNTTRADRKKATAEANKKGELVPAGQGK
jgi:hypothetical protein